MSLDIDVASVQHYTTNVELLLQQKGSQLQHAVGRASYKGKAAKAVEQIGAVIAEKVQQRHADTPLNKTQHQARWVFPTDYIWADLIDDEDKLRSLIDPTSSYALNGSYALGRAMDDEIIAAFFGTAKVGENGNENRKFLGKQIIEKDGKGLTVDKLQQAKRLLRSKDVDLDHDPLYCAITAEQEHNLLQETKVISQEYRQAPVLENGTLTRFMGIEFIPIQRLPEKDGIRDVPLWSKSGMHLGMWNEIRVSIDKRSDKRNATQVMVKGTFGATRTDENKIVQIQCDENSK